MLKTWGITLMLSPEADGKMAKAGLMKGKNAHDWEEVSLATDKDPFADMNNYGARKCKKCGAFQQRFRQCSWMRVTGYRWEPLVGRCNPSKGE